MEHILWLDKSPHLALSARCFTHTSTKNPPSHYQVMEMREEVDQTSELSELQQLHTNNRDKQSTLFSELRNCFRQGDLSAAKKIATELIYVVKLEHAIKEKLP